MIKDYYIVGGDTETCEGKPFSFQFYSEQLKLKKIIWVEPKTSTRKMCEFMDTLPDGESVIWFHNLAFDLISLFYDRHVLFVNEDFGFTAYGWDVQGIYANVRFIKCTRGKKIVHILDTGAYYKTRLEKLAEMFCPELPKLNKPSGLGTKIFDESDDMFCDYAMRDSEITYNVGVYLCAKHKEYEIPLSVSAPHFAANIFKHRHMKKDIPLPKRAVIFSSLHSYHGGKNNITVPYGWYEKVKLLDIISAYPAAMSELPSFTNSDAYKSIEGSDHPESDLPRLGVYRISGHAKECKWPILYDRGFSAIQGEFSNEWVTGPELNEAVRSKEISITSLYGTYYDKELDNETSPFKSFVEEFYSLKNEADSSKDKVNREFYKLLLNSLYGKFIQSKGDKAHLGYYYDMDKQKISHEKLVIAGGLFHPFIASLITGIVRAKIHQLEHKYSALHTATDGIFTFAKNFREDNKLGGLKLEAYGDLLLFRNKLYILYGPKGASKLKSSVFKERTILKFALHGFNGSVFDLERIYVTGDPTYEFKKVNKLRESLRRGYNVNAFEKRQGTLNVEDIVKNAEATTTED